MALRKFDHIYALDCSGLTDGASYSHLGVPLLGDPFYLHQITGLKVWMLRFDDGTDTAAFHHRAQRNFSAV